MKVRNLGPVQGVDGMQSSNKKVKNSVCRMTAEKQDKYPGEIVSMVLLKSIKAVGEIDEKLESPEFCQATIIESNYFFFEIFNNHIFTDYLVP